MKLYWMLSAKVEREVGRFGVGKVGDPDLVRDHHQDRRDHHQDRRDHHQDRRDHHQDRRDHHQDRRDPGLVPCHHRARLDHLHSKGGKCTSVHA